MSFALEVGEYSGFGSISFALRTVRTSFAAFAVTACEKEISGLVQDGPTVLGKLNPRLAKATGEHHAGAHMGIVTTFWFCSGALWKFIRRLDVKMLRLLGRRWGEQGALSNRVVSMRQNLSSIAR